MSAEMVELLRERLSSMQALSLVITDQSHRHAGHAGAKEGGHYELQIVATAFAGKHTVVRHRLIYAAIGDLMQRGIHALSIRALAPGEV